MSGKVVAWALQGVEERFSRTIERVAEELVVAQPAFGGHLHQVDIEQPDCTSPRLTRVFDCHGDGSGRIAQAGW